MSRKYRREERDWPRQQQNWPEQNQWTGERREDEEDWNAQGPEGRNWREDEYQARRGQDWGGQSRGQWSQGPQRNQDEWRGGSERDRMQSHGTHRWGSERNWDIERNMGGQGRGNWQSDQGWDRGNQDWQSSRGGGMQSDRGWDRENWQGGRQGSWSGDRWQSNAPRSGQREHPHSDWGNANERYEGLGGRGWREGLDDAMRDRSGQYAGRGPRSYKRTDSRIEEDINDRLTQHPMIDASDIEVSVQNGEVTLRGHVETRDAKRLAEDVAEGVFGAKDVNNQIRIKQRGATEETRQQETDPGKQRKAG